MQRAEHEEKYALTRRGFLDAVWNRIEIVHVYSTSEHKARIFALPWVLDKYGRVKVALAINPDFPGESQAHSLVHEMIHVDRQSWERVKGLSPFSFERQQIASEEEQLAEEAATVFYENNKQLAATALSHVLLRREELEI